MGMLQGKVAVVTNAGGRMGEAIALLMADEGARVVAHDSEAVVQGIRERGGEAVGSSESVETWEGSQHLAQVAIDHFGRLDVLVNSLKVDDGLRAPRLSEIEREEWECVERGTLKAAFCCTRAVLPHMRKQGQGRLIHLVLPEGFLGRAGHTHHGAAEMAVVGLSRNAAIDMERFHVTSNCVVPFSRAAGGSEPADPSPLAVFLASDAASGLSGQIFGVEGKEVFLFSQSRILRSMHNSEGWTVERLSGVFERTMGPYFTPLDRC
jgi:NAD(P)-dependent dehydrogenase (short-subunit alcohol dehydrogenase family)